MKIYPFPICGNSYSPSTWFRRGLFRYSLLFIFYLMISNFEHGKAWFKNYYNWGEEGAERTKMPPIYRKARRISTRVLGEQ